MLAFKNVVKSNSLQKCLLLFGVIIIISKFFLIGKGHLDDSDEGPFIFLLQNQSKILSLEANAWNNMVFEALSTYPETAIRSIESIFLTAYANILNLPITSTKALEIMGFFNLLTHIFILFFLYKIFNKLNFNNLISFLGVIIYASFLNSNLYIRHILPYDHSLLFHLISINILIVKDRFSNKNILYSGIFLALGFFTYFGNFIFIFINTYLIFSSQETLIKRIKFLSIHATPGIILLFIFEYISSINSLSYIKHILFFSTTIYQGTPSEAIIYIYKYFIIVEKYWGIIILSLFMIGFIILNKNENKKTTVKRFVEAGILAYFIYGLYCLLSEEMVFYGRVLHLYYIFIPIPVIYLIKESKILVGLTIILSFINLFKVIHELNQIDYPRSILYQYNLFDKNEKITFTNELKAGISYDYKETFLTNDSKTFSEINILDTPKKFTKFNHQMIVVNLSFFYHYPDTFIYSYNKFIPPLDYKLKVRKNHFMSHPAYTFEYCTEKGRNFFINEKLKILIYERN